LGTNKLGRKVVNRVTWEEPEEKKGEIRSAGEGNSGGVVARGAGRFLTARLYETPTGDEEGTGKKGGRKGK